MCVAVRLLAASLSVFCPLVSKVVGSHTGTKLPRHLSPGFVSSLKEARYWSLDWVSENGVAGPFKFVVLLKADGGYRVFGEYATATEAFEDRRRLVAETGNRSFFLRALRVAPVHDSEVVGPNHPDTLECLDRWRDAFATADESLLRPEELPHFRYWASSQRY